MVLSHKEGGMSSNPHSTGLYVEEHSGTCDVCSHVMMMRALMGNVQHGESSLRPVQHSAHPGQLVLCCC